MLLFASILAFASEPLKDHGALPAEDPYVLESNNFLTQGRMPGFRAVYVKPEEFAASLKPNEEATQEGHGDLEVSNPTSSWADVSINGQRAARIGPFANAHIKTVRKGRYDLTFTLTNGRPLTVSQTVR